jgi:hypothetical protein
MWFWSLQRIPVFHPACLLLGVLLCFVVFITLDDIADVDIENGIQWTDVEDIKGGKDHPRS